MDEPRVRIRDAAMRQFAAHGFKGATVRGIAREAGVSPGLVQHHFPSKQALREECDAYGFAFLRDIHERVRAGGTLTDAAFAADVNQAAAVLGPYAAMAIVSDGAEASRWFDELAKLYEVALGVGAPGSGVSGGEDADAVIATYTAMELGIAIFGAQLSRRLGGDLSDPSVVARLGRARLFLAAERLIDEDTEQRVRDGLDAYEKTAGG
jgi:AcrR family transcriptional regulator